MGEINVSSNVKKKKDITIGAFTSAAAVFMLCAGLGWVWEELYCLIKHGFWVERGFLLGPYLPIYGIGGSLIYFLKNRIGKSPVRLFLLATGISGAVEYLGSYFLEVIYGRRWWDYSEKLFNINGRVHLFGLVFFGFIGCLAAHTVLPLWLVFISGLDKRIVRVGGSIILGIFFSDILISLLLQFVA